MSDETVAVDDDLSVRPDRRPRYCLRSRSVSMLGGDGPPGPSRMPSRANGGGLGTGIDGYNAVLVFVGLDVDT